MCNIDRLCGTVKGSWGYPHFGLLFASSQLVVSSPSLFPRCRTNEDNKEAKNKVQEQLNGESRKVGQEKLYQARNQERWTAAIPIVEPSVRSTDVTEAKLTYTSHSQMSTEDF